MFKEVLVKIEEFPEEQTQGDLGLVQTQLPSLKLTGSKPRMQATRRLKKEVFGGDGDNPLKKPKEAKEPTAYQWYSPDEYS